MLDQLLDDVRSGTSRALVVRGEQGVGKTALLEYVAEHASGCRVERAASVQSEMELAFAGLHQLCAPMLERIDQLPGPQREAIGIAFGLSEGQPPDHFLVGLAVLGLLAEVARERPLVCLIDDAQWLDHASAQVLRFVARRLDAESVALVFSARERGEGGIPSGMPELVVRGLPDDVARAFLASAVPGPVDERVLNRSVAEARGNPLALMELPRGLTRAGLAGGFGLPSTRSVPVRIEESFLRQLAPLGPSTRQLLLVAVADPLGDPMLMWRAAERLGIDAEAASSAIAAGLFEINARVRFRHPMLRSAIYSAASVEERRAAHQALAEATDPEADPDRRAWHRAKAASGPDEAVATDLEHSANRAQARGGLAAAAAFLERAAELTREPGRRAERTLAAAEATQQAGAPNAALDLLSRAETGPLDELQRARVDLLHAQIAFTVGRGREAPPLLLRAARQLEPLDVRLARETHLDSVWSAMYLGALANDGGTGGLLEAAEAARAAPPPTGPVRAADLLLDGLALGFTQGYLAGVPALKRALRSFRSPVASLEEELRWVWNAHVPAVNLWDDETWEVLTVRHLRLAREAGALGTLPRALVSRIFAHVVAGELTAAATLVEELRAVDDATGSLFTPLSALSLAAVQGREADVAGLVETATEDVHRLGMGIGLPMIGWAQSVLLNSLGRYEDALATALRTSAQCPERLGGAKWPLVELVEAAARSGQPEHAVDALDRLAVSTRASGTDWGSGIEARCRALVSADAVAEPLYREAIDRLSLTRIRAELGRAHLLYGEWLRRVQRPLDAREQLRTAHGMFAGMGMDAFARRAEGELLASGETVHRRTVEISSELTPQEAQIARLVREGLTNPEIGARLFLSPRTVEWHLHKVFTKLDITSRRQLHS